MKKYDTYKDSGIEWIGEIPSHWDMKRFKYCFNFVNDKIDADLPKIGLEHIESWTGKLVGNESDYEGDGTYFKPNDILFGKLRPYLAKVHLSKIEGKAVGDFFVFRSSNAINPKYGHKLLLSRNFIDLTNSSTFGSKMPRVSPDFIAELKTIIPPFDEQTAIAHYLDRKTAEIEELIVDKKRLLELYEEEKTAIINQAVTKGINPDAPMKDSGIEWLGEIPEHWEVKRLKHVSTKIGDGIHTTPSYLQGTEIYFINGVNLNNGEITLTDKTLSVPIDEYDKYKIDLKQGAILVSLNGTIGKLAFYNNEKVILGKSAAYIELREQMLNKFIYYLLKSQYINNYFEDSFSGTTIKNLSLYTLRNTPFPYMELEEQICIVNHLERECFRIDSKKDKTEKLIDLLTEYRTALISEVVTGKIKVIE